MLDGVLPLLLGKGTLLSKYLINHDKIYIVKLQLGTKTDTADSEGKIIEEKDIDEQVVNKENIIRVLKSFIGKQEQVPPIYSAIKLNGKKLYEYARKGQKVELKPRQIEIYNIELINYSQEEKQIEFKVFCGKGTYIRSLCEDVATKLETVGYMKELERIQVGEFSISESVTIEELQNNIENEDFINNKLISIEKLFEQKNQIKLDEKRLKHFLNGVKITQKYPDEIYRIYNENDEFIGIGVVQKNLLKRDIII